LWQPDVFLLILALNTDFGRGEKMGDFTGDRSGIKEEDNESQREKKQFRIDQEGELLKEQPK